MELDFDAAELVDVDFLAAGADDDGGLRAFNDRFTGAAFGAEERGCGDALELVFEDETGIFDCCVIL